MEEGFHNGKNTKKNSGKTKFDFIRNYNVRKEYKVQNIND